VEVLEVPGWTVTLTVDFARDGAILGAGVSGPNYAREMLRISGGSAQDLGAPPSSTNALPSPHGFSSDGRIITGEAWGTTWADFRPFVIGRDGVSHFPLSSDGSFTNGFGTGVSDSGLVVGFFGAPAPSIWTEPNGTMSLHTYLAARAVPGIDSVTLSGGPLITPNGKMIVALGAVPGYSGNVALVKLCYANCDDSPGPSPLNIADFVCFVQRFASGDSYANCDHSTTPPVLNVIDFTCFLQKYAAGCQ
jgi:hypothetical protein